jgi:hypothetical protein
MTDSGDRWLNAVGIFLVLAVVAGLGVVLLAGSTLGPGSNQQPPSVDWTLERVSPETVRITHNGGDPVQATDLVVTVESFTRRTDWEGTITEGDATLITASEGQVVRIYWAPDDRGARSLMRTWTV